MSWKHLVVRHIAAMAWFVLMTIAMMQLHSGQHPVHYWNRVMADVSFLSLALILAIGPLARFWKWFARFRPYRRELGIAFALAALVHVLLYLDGAHDWNVFAFFFAAEEGHATVLRRNTAAAANWIGLIALVYGAALTVTSNDWSQRRLGKGWKFLQQQVYTLLIAASLHIAIYLYLVYQAPSGFAPWFWGALAIAVALQLAGYFTTVGKSRRSRQARERAR